MAKRPLLWATLLLLTAPSCAVHDASQAEQHQTEDAASLAAAFDDAAEATQVPVALLKAVAWTRTRLQDAPASVEFDGESEAGRHGHAAALSVGVMGLDASWLEAELAPDLHAMAGTTDATVREDPRANVAFAAAVLAELGAQTDAQPGDIDSWAEAAARYSALDAGSEVATEEARATFVHDEVWAVMRDGFATEGLVLVPSDVTLSPDFPAPNRRRTEGEVAGSTYIRSPNQSGRAGHAPQMVVIHSCEGSYASCWSWLANRRSRASAHYVINENGSKIRQLVKESRKAWHVRADYRHHLNVGDQTPDPAEPLADLHGRGTNGFTIGIEHAGRASQTHWDEGLLDASARTVCEITRRYDIPVDRFHILSHGQLQPENRSDPGAHWPWDDYMQRIADFRARDCDLPPPAPEGLSGLFSVIIDSRQSANPEHTSMTRSSAWRASTAGTDFFNTGWWRRAAENRDGSARFTFRLAEARRVQLELWWPSDFSGATAVPVTLRKTDGPIVAELQVDQSTGGGQWVELGSFELEAGMNELQISARTNEPGRFVAADAIRVQGVE